MIEKWPLKQKWWRWYGGGFVYRQDAVVNFLIPAGSVKAARAARCPQLLATFRSPFQVRDSALLGAGKPNVLLLLIFSMDIFAGTPAVLYSV